MKVFRFCAMICAAVLLTGCNDQETAMIERVDHTPPETEIAAEQAAGSSDAGLPGVAGIVVNTMEAVYPPDVSEIKLFVANDTDEDYCLPERFALSSFQPSESAYVEIPYRENGDYFTEMAIVVPAHGDATLTFDISAHYDLPLDIKDSGQYRIQVGDIAAEFTVSADGEMPVQMENQIIMDVEQESYPAGTKEIAVRLINAGDSDYTFTNEDFGIEQFGDGFVSMTPFSKDSPAAQNGMTLAPDACEMWTLTLSDFSGLELQTGEYAVYLAGVEARFKVT